MRDNVPVTSGSSTASTSTISKSDRAVNVNIGGTLMVSYCVDNFIQYP